jgi:hypothetical protein
MAKSKRTKTKKNTVNHGNNKPGYGKPPREYQWQPGESGNPKGQPKHRTHLWTYYCQYMSMTNAQRGKLDKSKLTAAQQTALKLVEQAVAGEDCGSERMARYVVDREEGRAVEHLIIGTEDILSDEECEQIRELIAKNYGGSDQQPDSIRGQGDPDVPSVAGTESLSPQPG